MGTDWAENGVTMFFALSGFLITYLLLEERNKGDIDVTKFYIRRILRIWPLYFSYLIVAVAVIMSARLYGQPWNIIFYALFAGNIAYAIGIKPIPLIGHFWTIGVEEQFYLFWPWLLKLKRNTIAVIAIFTFCFLLLKVAARVLLLKFGHCFYIPCISLYLTRFDCMAIGALASYLYLGKNRVFIKLTTSLPAQLLCWGAVALMIVNKFSFGEIIQHDLVSIVTVCIILGQIVEKNRVINLNNSVCEVLGKISYGIYVVHPLVLFLYMAVVPRHISNPSWLAGVTYPTVIVLTIMTAYISYRYFEKKFLTIKNRYTTITNQPV